MSPIRLAPFSPVLVLLFLALSAAPPLFAAARLVPDEPDAASVEDTEAVESDEELVLPEQRRRRLESVAQDHMSLAEVDKFFETVEKGTPVRLIYTNGSEYAGNFDSKDPDGPTIFCRRGLAKPAPVPLEKAAEVYLMPSNAAVVRLKREDLTPP